MGHRGTIGTNERTLGEIAREKEDVRARIVLGQTVLQKQNEPPQSSPKIEETYLALRWKTLSIRYWQRDERNLRNAPCLGLEVAGISLSAP